MGDRNIVGFASDVAPQRLAPRWLDQRPPVAVADSSIQLASTTGASASTSAFVPPASNGGQPKVTTAKIAPQPKLHVDRFEIREDELEDLGESDQRALVTTTASKFI